MLNDADSRFIAARCESVVGTEMDAALARLIAAQKLASPHVLMRPAVYIDGNKWCALYGDNIQDGVAGFGDSPAEAMSDFDANWTEKLARK
jgi:hypothetical protein